MNLRDIPPKKVTGALDDLIDVFIEHDFTVKEAQLFLQSPDILSDMMSQFMVARAVNDTWSGKMLIKEPPLRWDQRVFEFIQAKYPHYNLLLSYIDQGDVDQILISRMQRREIYDQYKIWCSQQNMRSLRRISFYEILELLNFRLRKEKDHGPGEKDQGLSASSFRDSQSMGSSP